MTNAAAPDALPDLIRRGLGMAARAAGAWCDVFRPRDGGPPLRPENRVMRLPALFTPRRAGARPDGTQTWWDAVLDAAYVRPGDYVAAAEGVFFVAALPRLEAAICVLTTGSLDIARPRGAPLAGANGYAGADPRAAAPVLAAWPAHLSRAGVDRLPQQGSLHDAVWIALMPVLPPSASLRAGDLVRDAHGNRGFVAQPALSATGWSLRLQFLAA